MAPLPADKLAKLIPLLASDHDGEVVSAARAIGRALKAANCDFHDIVKALSTAATPHGLGGLGTAYDRQRAEKSQAGAFYTASPYGPSAFDDALREFRKANSEFFREAGEADRLYAEAMEAQRRGNT